MAKQVQIMISYLPICVSECLLVQVLIILVLVRISHVLSTNSFNLKHNTWKLSSAALVLIVNYIAL